MRIPHAFAIRLGAILAPWLFLSAFDPTFPTCCDETLSVKFTTEGILTY